jgi:hypothetical protein
VRASVRPADAKSGECALIDRHVEGWIQAFDHVTAMPKQISSTLCHLSTGAGFSVSVGASLISISVARPVLMTVPICASGAAWRPTTDLVDRMLTVTLPALTAQTRRPESEIAGR